MYMEANLHKVEYGTHPPVCTRDPHPHALSRVHVKVPLKYRAPRPHPLNE